MRRLAILAPGVLAVVLAACSGTTPSPAGPSGVPGSTAGPTAAIASANATPPAPTPEPSDRVPASPTPSAPATPETTMTPFTLASTAFAAGGSIPRRFTCDGADVSPALTWTGAPSGTAALVLVVDDPDAHGWVHWLVLDLPGTINGTLPEAVSPSAGDPAQGTNDFGRRGWGGPCPPSGTHRYTFTLYSLGAPLGLPGAPDGGAVRSALGRATVLGKAVLQATYRRGG